MHYYYLYYSLIFFALALLLLALRKDLQHKALSAIVWGSIGGPVVEIFDYRDYWRPQTLLGKGHVSLEDVIFGASICTLAFLLYPFLARKSLSESKLNSKQQNKRIIIYGICALSFFIVLIGLFKVNSVFATAIDLLVCWLVEVWQRRDLLRPSLIVGLCFVVISVFIYGAGVSLVGQQVLKNTWLLYGKSDGWLFLGRIPVSEMIWFFTVGAFLSVFDLYTSGKTYINEIRS